MAQITYHPSSLENFHLEGYEVTLDKIDMKLSDFEDKGQMGGNNLCILPITIKINENLNIAGDVYKNGREFGFTLYEVRQATLKYDLKTIGTDNSIFEQLYGMGRLKEVGISSSILTKSSVNQNVDAYYATNIIQFQKPNGILSIQGRITFKILLAKEISKKPQEHDWKEESLIWRCLVSTDAIENLKKDENFIIKCKGQNFNFNKTLLCIVSDVFRTMIQGQLGQEAQEGTVEINDFNPDTIRAFNRICFENKDFEEGDSIPELLLFAQKYFMDSLKQKCLKNLVTNLNTDNIYEIIKIADQIDDEKLLKICAKYMKSNNGKLDENAEWLAFLQSNPNCMFKIMKFMLYA